ncbi:hypothetical protein B4589_012305 [Halolamina sp. CBA1230]|uniref:hypothetical protein n=1 Tax=Halolamina sp. CBA1230 TaxID=1853690 RepID=UPI00117B82AF|nr:hypothetical protein [Halolamina sp. CBA1230]QKY21116.1 hypothetical protein B4589_012305 [Halolamina sp. CBA1230]
MSDSVIPTVDSNGDSEIPTANSNSVSKHDLLYRDSTAMVFPASSPRARRPMASPRVHRTAVAVGAKRRRLRAPTEREGRGSERT